MDHTEVSRRLLRCKPRGAPNPMGRIRCSCGWQSDLIQTPWLDSALHSHAAHAKRREDKLRLISG